MFTHSLQIITNGEKYRGIFVYTSTENLYLCWQKTNTSNTLYILEKQLNIYNDIIVNTYFVNVFIFKGNTLSYQINAIKIYPSYIRHIFTHKKFAVHQNIQVNTVF